MDPETHESSLAAKSDIHVKGSKRMKILKEREDCVSSTLSAKMGIDMEEKTTRDAPKVVDSFDPFAIHNLSRTLDRSRFGSVTEEIEALRSEKRKRLNLISHRMKLPQSFMSSDVGKTKRRNFLNLAEKQDAQPSHSNVINKHVSPPVLLVDIDLQVSNQATETFSDQSVTQPAQNVLHLEDDNARNGDKEVPTVIIIIDSSDDEDDEVQMLSYHCHKAAKIVTDVPSMNDPMVRDSAEKEAPQNEGGSAATENDIGLSKSSNLHDYCVEVRDSVEREVHEEEGSNKSAFVIDIADDIGSRPSEIYIEMNKIVDHVTDCSERKALEEEVEADPDIDVKSAKSSYIETDGNMMIEEDNDPIHIADNVGSQSSKIVAEMGISFDHVEKETSGKEVESVPDIAVMDKMHIDTSDDMVIEEINEQSDLATDDCLDNIWREMAFAFESSKDIAPVSVSSEHKEDDEECDHIFVLKDDLGDVCRICGIIGKSIETIFDFQYSKVVRTIRTYASEPRNRSSRGLNTSLPSGVNSLPDNSMPSETCIHPRHRKQMKPHQVEGFNFLCNNLLADKPGGCILAHAPGSGKTFMIISFLQSFLAKHPNGRPLVILPKGILATWKKEFQTWQVEDMALLDFYSSKAESRSQQLDVLLQWENHKSILFLGYQQFSKIVCDRSKEAADCQDKLLKVPSILILDEGHTPRNDETDIVQSLAKVRTPRKVVLSGTLYQNHVKEVFSILNLVRPKFLRLDTSIAARNSIMSIVHVPGSRKHLKAGNDSAFFELVENTLQKDENLNRKKAVIRKLREMTTNVLHYYKGDSLDELPGLVDFTVVLNLSEKQKEVVQKLKKENRFKQFALGSALYVHPELKDFSALSSASKDRNSSINNEKIDKMLEKLNPRHGVKMKFFLNILGLCESTGEKLLVFSQYILPLKFLERASVKSKGWIVGKEIFLITGDTNDEQRERFMQQFNSSPDAKVFFGSIKACGEGISLVGASRILILDVHLNPSVTRQALGRAFRPGQKRKVYTYRLIAAGSPEEEDYHTCFRKEIISKMWFEWNESSEYRDSQLKNVDLDECDDMFFESPLLKEDLKVLYTR